MLPSNISATPLRRSARKKLKYVSNSSSRSDTNTSNEPDTKKRESVAQTSSKPKSSNGTGRRTGRLASMSDMPLDVLFEVFGHLHPYDLLKLSRTTKDYRKLLLDPHSVTLWKTACQNVEGLPEPFDGICLPAWVNLLFYPHCHFCSRVAHTIEWVFKLRICSHCAPQHLGKSRTWYMAPSRLSNSGFPARAVHENLIPSRHSNNHREIFYLQSEHDSVCAQYEELQTDAARAQFIEDRKMWVDEINKHTIVCQTWEKNQASHRENELQELREERISAIREKLKELGWEQDLNGIQYPDALSKHKLVNKPQRLTKRIWSNIQAEVIQFMEEMREKRLKRERAALIVARKVIAADFWRAYRVSHVHDRQLLPNPVEFCSFQPVADVVNQDSEIDVTLASYQSLTPQLDNFVSQWRHSMHASLYEQLKQPVPVYYDDDWDDESQGGSPSWDDEDWDDWNIFRSSKPKNGPSPFENISVEDIENRVKLAQTVFSCSKCSSDSRYDDLSWYSNIYGGRGSSGKHIPMFYPQVLAHQCCDCKMRICMDDDDFYTMYTGTLSPSRFLPLLQSWSPGCLSIDVKMSNIASSMLSVVDNIDPRTVTVEHMDNLNIRYTCLHRWCAKKVSGGSDASTSPLSEETNNDSYCSPTFDWRGAIQHHRNKHDGVLEGIKVKYAIEQQAAIPASIQDEERLYVRDHTDGWVCMHCNKSNGGDPCSLTSIKSHLSSRHNIEEITEDQDYTRAFDWLDIHPSTAFFRPVRMTANGPVLE